MADYISSNANRFYVAVETSYGQAEAVTQANRFPAVRLQAEQLLQRGKRLDKTGTRTFFGTSKDERRETAFEARTYLTSWDGTGEPSYGPLFQAALGAIPQLSSGLIVASVQSSNQLQTTLAHGLSVGSAVSYQNEIRFVTAVPDTVTMILNAPFTNAVSAGAALPPTMNYSLSTELPSLTLYDYWDPSTAVSRIVTGSAVNILEISVNGDYHEFTFNGPAADLLDSSSFATGMGGLTSFPTEPALAQFDYSIVPGHLGEVWLGSTASQFFTLTEASIAIKNNIDVRNQEFGSSFPLAIAPGPREVATTFTVFARDDAQTIALYAAAKERTLISAMLQLGQQQGKLMGVFLPEITPEIPTYNDSETRLRWEFKNNLAQGASNDEIYIAFA
ncbi:MAG: hypothetical protein JOZ48_08070 [Acidobacteriaceae bacterium]|nr:hypothetical protein [Acidobacteriaceae bacterium]